jgi:hypothetical protein
MADLTDVSTVAIERLGDAPRELKPLPERRKGGERRKNPPETGEPDLPAEEMTTEDASPEETHQLDVNA